MEVAPSRLFSSSSRKPLVMARATTSAETPAMTPMIEITVTTEMTDCLRLALRYRSATKSSKRIQQLH